MERTLDHDHWFILWGGGASFVASLITFKFLGPAVSRAISPTYKHLTTSVRGEWDDRVMSNVNAVVAMSLGGYSLLCEEGMRNDVIWYDSKVARLACAIVVGYMLADIVAMLLWCQVSKSELVGFIGHHLASVYAYYVISIYGVLCYFGMLRLLAEFSTPNVNQRWFFDVIGYPRNNYVVVANGFMMLITFFLCRMVTMPLYWYQIWLISGTDDAAILGYIQPIMYIPCLVLDSLNIYWFYKMCKGFLKALKSMKAKGVKSKSV